MIFRNFFDPPSQRFVVPSSDLDGMRRQMERLLDAFGERPLGRGGVGVFPAVNISEDADAYHLSAELPGVKTADLNLNVTGNQLTLAGERKISEEAADARYHRREREAGRFSRAVTLPGEIDSDQVTAKLVDGILTVTVSKAQKAKPRQIAVQ